MLCEKCKIREANIKYTEVINGVKTEHNLCSQCAKEMDFGYYSAIFDGEFPIGKLLSGLLGVEDEKQENHQYQKIVCPNCKTSYEEFVKNSRFGCKDCYGVFDVLIHDNIKQLQGSDTHTGKKPKFQSDHLPEENESGSGKAGSVDSEIKVWDAKLKDALKKEEYELAAQYRDKIKELKEGKEDHA